MIKMEVPNNIHIIFGTFDANLKKIEKAFNVTIQLRESYILINGDKSEKAKIVITELEKVLEKGDEITELIVNTIIQNIVENDEKLDASHICMTANGKSVKAKTKGQQNYVNVINQNTITFGIGPAGVGKTYLAMAKAITEFKNGNVNRIILTRPAIEAGENLGFLPGDLQQKVDPYLRPLYDALHEIMGSETFLKNMEKGLIEVAPLAYMRGRTLDNSFIVLDEAQNTTKEQMKMFLTRIGYGSKAIITGDLTQTDLKIKESGLKEAIFILNKVEDIGIVKLTNKDVVRHPLVQSIIKAYEKHENTKGGNKK